MGYLLPLFYYLRNEYYTEHNTARRDVNTPLKENRSDRRPCPSWSAFLSGSRSKRIRIAVSYCVKCYTTAMTYRARQVLIRNFF